MGSVTLSWNTSPAWRRWRAASPSRSAAERAGLWHDLGKFHPEFQRYLLESEASTRRRGHGPDHKGAGATVAAATAGPLAFAVAGHHGGLHEFGELGTRLTGWRGEPRIAEALTRARAAVSLHDGLRLQFPGWVQGDRRSLELFLRMLFSCLVDADFLDTEAHFQPVRAAGRADVPTIADLWPAFERRMADLTGRLSSVAHPGLGLDED